MMVVGLMLGQEVGCFSMRCLRSDGKEESQHVWGQIHSRQAEHHGMLRLSQAQHLSPTSPAGPCGHHSLVLLNIGHNSSHGDEGPGGGGQGGRQPPQQHLGGRGGPW